MISSKDNKPYYLKINVFLDNSLIEKIKTGLEFYENLPFNPHVLEIRKIF
jgi:hypothetical protein